MNEDTVDEIDCGKYLIRIFRDDFASNPRNTMDNVGIIAAEDSNKYVRSETPSSIMFTYDRQSDYEMLERKFGAVAILPLYVFDHSACSISTTPFNNRWDSGQIGWVYATRESISNTLGIDIDRTPDAIDQVNSAMLQEIEILDQYWAGEVYRYELYEKSADDGEDMLLDLCGDIYGEDETRKEALQYLKRVLQLRDKKDFPLFYASGVELPVRDDVEALPFV